MSDMRQLADAVTSSVKGYVGRVRDEINGRLDALTKRFDSLPTPKDGENGRDGKDADPDAVAELVLKRIPTPKDGAPGVNGKDGSPGRDGKDGINGEKGQDGKSIDVGELSHMVVEAAAKAVAAIPRPADGKDGSAGINGKDGATGKDGANGMDGKDGAAGKDGAPGRDGVDGPAGKDGADGKSGADGRDGKDGAPGRDGKDIDPEHARTLVAAEVSRAVKELPPAQPGKDANEAEIILRVTDNVMKSIRMPQDGKSVTIDDMTPVFEGEVARWALEFERRAADSLQRAVDKLPKPKDGRDGLSLDNFDAELKDGGRVLVLKVSGGGREVVRELTLDTLIGRGIYKSGGSYRKGDAVTYAGSLWTAQKDTAFPPKSDKAPDDWALSVKCGRDGKDAQ